MTTNDLKEADLTSRIINTFYRVYDELGYGFLESVYCAALAIEFRKAGLAFIREAPSEVFYHGEKVGLFRSDFLVENRIVVEVKASKTTGDDDRRQILNYLRATTLELAMMLHFGPKPDFKRLIFENQRKRSLPVVAHE